MVFGVEEEEEEDRAEIRGARESNNMVLPG
jgi:hypothetical protein